MTATVYEIFPDDNAWSVIVRIDGGMNAALDYVARGKGFLDYSDMARQLDWTEDEGLNIVRIGTEEDLS